MSLAQELREATTENHKAAEGAGFIRDLMGGRVDRELYSRHLSYLYDLYVALETGIAGVKDHETMGAFYLPELERVPSLAADLRFFSGDDFLESRIPESGPATAAYCRHLRNISAESPELLVAHAYVRYLGDLSGGQMIKKVVARNLGLEPEPGAAGMTFYEFPDIPDIQAFKDDYRARLDAFTPLAVTQAEVIEEARLAFDLNGAMMQDLDTTAET